MAVDLTVAHEDREFDLERLRTLVQHVLDAEAARVDYVSVVLSDRASVHRLNRDYLSHDYPTDVLSFALHAPDEPVEGEVYVDLDMAAERAPEFGADFDDEAARYVVHGILHLCGHNDATDADRAGMRELEDRYLAEAWLR